MHPTRYLIFLIIYVFLFTMSKVNAYSYSADDLKKLEKGEIILERLDTPRKSKLEAAEATILVKASPKKVWDVLDHQENLVEIVPNIKDIKVLEKEFPFQKVRVKLDPGIFVPAFDYTLLFDQSEIYKKIKFKRIDGSFKELYGTWVLEPYNGYTILTYTLYIDFGFYMPTVLKKLGLNKMLPQTLKGIKSKSES
ncbi:MAG: hypothetical protein A2Y25_03270 [Candidatus Melainabacteria bacterium GWF2_37_15]|nr:MAG: hypothetical protein A2Y25_03270 [Candidatus Melainabacteria bacterium GWF2_37_15]